MDFPEKKYHILNDDDYKEVFRICILLVYCIRCKFNKTRNWGLVPLADTTRNVPKVFQCYSFCDAYSISAKLLHVIAWILELHVGD